MFHDYVTLNTVELEENLESENESVDIIDDDSAESYLSKAKNYLLKSTSLFPNSETFPILLAIVI